MEHFMDRNIMNIINLCFNACNSILILSIFILTLKKINDSTNRSNFLFLASTILIYVITDCSTWAFEGTDAAWKIPALRIVTFLYYLDNPFIFIAFMKFLRNILNEEYVNNKFYITCLVPCILDLIGIFFSCFPGFYYHISPENVYSRSQFHIIHVILVLIFYIFLILYIVSNKKHMDKKTFFTVLTFPTLPAIFYIPQFLFYGIATTNLGFVISLLLIYLNLNKSMQIVTQKNTVFSTEYFQKKGSISFAEKIKRVICSYGFSENAVDSIKDELKDNISSSLLIISFASSILMGICFVSSFFISNLVPQRFLYLGTTTLCIFLIFWFKKVKNHRIISLIFSYMFFILMFAANIFACMTLVPEQIPVIFVFVLCVAPPVFCDKPFIIILIEYASVFIYMDLARIYKTPECALTDTLYLWVLTTLGLIIGYGMSKTKLTSIYLTKNLDNEVAAKRKQINAISKEIVTTLTSSIESKDEYTNGHSERVANYSVLIAEKIGWNENKCEELWMEAVLHDVGKIGIPDNILKKTEKLTDEEFKIIQTHTTKGAKILENLSSFPKAKEAANYHHERINGKGYPEGLQKDDISEAVKIVSIADAYDAMTSSRCYRPALPDEVVISELKKGRGSQFDEKLLDAFLELLSEHGGSLIGKLTTN